MKSIRLLFLLLFIPFMVSAQTKKPWNDPGYDNKLVHFGFSVGINSMDLGIKRSMKSNIISNPILIPDVTKLQPGFQVQIISNLRLSDNFDLRFLPGISFGAREIIFYDLIDPGNKLKQSSVQIESNYLDFPLDLKYRARRLNNYRPYILTGLNYRFDMAARKETQLRFKPGDVYYEMGVGVDWYLPYFKLSTEIKLGIGLSDLLIRDTNSVQNYLASIDKVNAYIVGLSFHFE